MGLFFNKDISTLYVGSEEVRALYLGSTQIWPVGLPAGTTFNFEYTGAVQSVDLPAGTYKCQCWGAQGGRSCKSSSYTGSKGGYSEGILTLTEPKTIYVFVGGQGSYGSSASIVNGGWNGGGGSVGRSSYTSGGTYGYSYPACGGGATDMCTVSSSMSYSSGRTQRSQDSLLSRFIVAGGGAGGSYAYYEKEEQYSTTQSKSASDVGTDYNVYTYGAIRGSMNKALNYEVTFCNNSNIKLWFMYYTSSNTFLNQFILDAGECVTKTIPSNTSWIQTRSYDAGNYLNIMYASASWEESTTSTSTSSDYDYSNKSQQGGGTSGRGKYPGTQTSAGNGGAFGYGSNQTITNYRYCSGAGGGGWYGGGSHYSDSSTSYVNYSGGGSGFVNTAANASSRPSGYTGLQLDSGTTTAGNTSFESVSGSTEKGHSGNGYARIIALDKNGEYPIPEPTSSISWETQTGTWNDSSNSSSATGYSYTCVSPGTNGSTILRCTFRGVSSITFYCTTSGESCCDYLTIGNLDSSCTRSNYKNILKNSSGSYTYGISDTGEHYVEFCYSKDQSVDSGTDNATVYIQSYS